MIKQDSKMKVLRKIIDILGKLENFLLGISSAVVSFYILILLWIVLSQKNNWPNAQWLFWLLIIISALISLIIGYSVWRKVSDNLIWQSSDSVINNILNHFDKKGTFILCLFLWMLAISIVFNSFSMKDNIWTSTIGENSIFENGKNILMAILGVLTIFNMGNIPIYNLEVNQRIKTLYEDNKNKIFEMKIWATNTGSANAAYKFIGLYNTEEIDNLYSAK